LFERFFVALASSLYWFLSAPARFSHQLPNMIAVIAHSKGPLDHFSHPTRCQYITSKSIGFGSLG